MSSLQALLERGASPHRGDVADWIPIYYAAAVIFSSKGSSSSSSDGDASSSDKLGKTVLALFPVDSQEQLAALGRAVSAGDRNDYVIAVMKCVANLPDFFDQVRAAYYPLYGVCKTLGMEQQLQLCNRSLPEPLSALLRAIPYGHGTTVV